MILNPSDIHTALASFAGVMFAEVVVKPVAIRVGRYLLRRLDGLLSDRVPDWLWLDSKRSGDE
jgi:hypothetical protein